MKTLLLQLDGSLPNLALMRIAYWCKEQGHRVEVHSGRTLSTALDTADKVYGSLIFQKTKEYARARSEEIKENENGD